MAKRRRYDTEALVAEIKSDRRMAVFFMAAAGLLVVGLFVAYLFMGDEAPPANATPRPVATLPAQPAPPVEPPSDAAAAPEASAAADEQPAAAAADATDPPPPPGDEGDEGAAAAAAAAVPSTQEAEPTTAAAQPAAVEVDFSRKFVIWVDGKKIGKLASTKLELSAGKHTLEVKVGRRKLSKEVEVEAGGSYKLSAKKRKILFEHN